MKFLFTLVATLAVGAIAKESVVDLAQSLKQDENGFVHLADDGVLRSYSPDGVVLDYAQLSHEQIAKYLAGLPPNYPKKDREHLDEVFKDVDGHDVKDAKLLTKPEGVNYPEYAFQDDDAPLGTTPRVPRGLDRRFACLHPFCRYHSYCRKFPPCRVCVRNDLINNGNCF